MDEEERRSAGSAAAGSIVASPPGRGNECNLARCCRHLDWVAVPGCGVGQVGDSSAADFTSGTVDPGAFVSRRDPPGVLLRPAEVAEFTGPDLPPGWFARRWAESGRVYFEDDGLVIDGALVGTDALIAGGRSLDFWASFAERPDQHVGFGVDYVHVPWCMFSTKWGRRLYARTNFTVVEDKKLPGDWLGSPHRFRIDWRFLYVDFEIDGQRLAHLLVPMPPAMRPLAGNARVGGPPLVLHQVRMSPYFPSGRFTSRVLDAGATVGWTEACWVAEMCDGTTLGLEWRTGDTAVPDGTWSGWSPLSAGAPLCRRSRYARYRASLATTDDAVTPVLSAVTLGYRSLERSSGSTGSD